MKYELLKELPFDRIGTIREEEEWRKVIRLQMSEFSILKDWFKLVPEFIKGRWYIGYDRVMIKYSHKGKSKYLFKDTIYY